jgi:Tfp pilus assembly protein PilF
MSGLHAEALHDYAAVVEMNPTDSTALNNIGALLANLGRLYDALPFFDRAANLGNSDARQAADRIRRQHG